MLVHAQALLTSSPRGSTHCIDADLRDTERVLAEARQVLDFSQPVAVMLLAVLHFVTDGQDPAGIIRAVMEPLAPGGRPLRKVGGLPGALGHRANPDYFASRSGCDCIYAG